MIRKNASVAFEMDCQNALQHGETACTHSYYYASVLGEGKAEILEGDEKCKGLSALMLHMAGRNNVFTAEMADKVAVIAIRVDALTAKKRPQPQARYFISQFCGTPRERNVLYALNCINPPITLVMRPPSLYQRNRRFFLLPKLLSFKKTVCCFCQNTLNSPRASGSSPPYRLK